MCILWALETKTIISVCVAFYITEKGECLLRGRN